MRAIFPSTIDGDLLQLVHLANSFRQIAGAAPLRVDDVCCAEASITAIRNTEAGKCVTARGYIYRNKSPVIEVTSSFLYRGKFADYADTFEITEEPEYLVVLDSETAVGVLQSKEWFEWTYTLAPLQAGMELLFRVRSEVTFKDPVAYHSVKTSGDIFITDQRKQLVQVGVTAFDQEDCIGNPVMAYLKRHGTIQGDISTLSTSGYEMKSQEVSAEYTAPHSNEMYAEISGDFNPIHVK